MKRIPFLVILIGLLSFSCGGTSRNGRFQIDLTDAPGLPDQLLVVIGEVTAHQTGGAWRTVSTESRTVDLVQLIGAQTRLVDVSLDPGSYTEVRLIVVSGQAVVGGQSHPLTIPSGEIKIPARFEVQEGGTTELLLDFDADKSLEVHPAGNGGEEYILRPVITLVRVTY